MFPTTTSDFKPDLKKDAVSGFLVFLIALPLCLGIAMASGFPPVAGVLTAIVGGVLSTFLGSAQLTIKGPAAGLIVIAIGAVQELGRGDMMAGYRRALAVVVITGAIQIVFAFLKAGKLADFFPSSVVHGMLAAIGVIILAKQAHTALGVGPEAKEPLGLLAEIPHSVFVMNPEIAIIGILSLLILFGFPLIRAPWARRIPAPMIVLVAAIPLGMYFDIGHEHTYGFGGQEYAIGPSYLVQLPGTLLSSLAFPDFGELGSLVSIKYIVMFALVGSIESLLSAKAVDTLDPKRRHNDMNRDLLATGIGNLVAGSIGGLPMISEIVRSSANIDAGAQSRMSNFFHGVYLLAFVAFLPMVLTQIPLGALGAMLIYTGARLASPFEFVRTFKVGPEQLVVFLTTFTTTLATDLLLGVGAGIAMKVVLHLVNGARPLDMLRARVDLLEEHGTPVLLVHGAAVFTNYLGLKKQIERASESQMRLTIDFSDTRLVDHTTIEKLNHMVDGFQRAGRELVIRGLDGHRALSRHELAARRKRPAESDARAV